MMKKNKLISSWVLAGFCLLATVTGQASTTDNMRLAIHCFTVSHNIEELVPVQTEEFCKAALKNSAAATLSSGESLIMSDSTRAKFLLDVAAANLADNKIIACEKSEMIRLLREEITQIKAEIV